MYCLILLLLLLFYSTRLAFSSTGSQLNSKSTEQPHHKHKETIAVFLGPRSFPGNENFDANAGESPGCSGTRWSAQWHLISNSCGTLIVSLFLAQERLLFGICLRARGSGCVIKAGRWMWCKFMATL
jgi:hypothetical protein